MPVFKVSPAIGRSVRRILVGDSSTTAYVVLGRLAEVGPRRDVMLDTSREHVVAIVGKRGSGKTHTLGVLAEGLALGSPTDSQIGTGSGGRSVLLLDTLNIFQWVHIPISEAKGPIAETQRSLLTKWQLTPAVFEPVYWHIGGYEPSERASNTFSLRPADLTPQDWGLLAGTDIATDPMGQLLVATYEKVTRTGWRRGQILVRPNSEYEIEDLIACIQEDSTLQDEFADETRRAVRQRLGAFLRSGLFSPRGTRLREVLQAGKIAVLLLARVPDNVRSLVAFLVIRRLLEERSAASERMKTAQITGQDLPSGDVPKAWVLIDEAQNIMPSRGASLANDMLTRFVREGRNFGLSMALSTQQPSAIDARIMAQVDTLVAHTLTVRQDVNYMLANMKTLEPREIMFGTRRLTLADALRAVDVGECVVSAVDAERTFFLSVRPRVTTHGGFEA
jgi:DNA helicase HerA-like ATPase